MTSVEKPPHADRDRIRHLTPEAIRDALRLETVPPAADPVAALLGHLDRPDRRHPLPRLVDQVGHITSEQRARVRAGAAAAVAECRSFTDRRIGRSQLYGFHYLGWTQPLLEQYLLTAEESWLRHWEEIFHRWYESRDQVRGDWPGLDVIWYTLGVSFRTSLFSHALDAGGDRLAPRTRVRLLGSILGGARWLAEEHDSYRPGNWQFVGVCTLLCTAAVFSEFREAPGWAATGRTRIVEHLERDVHPDGGHSERSPGYHRLCLEQVHLAVMHAERYLDWRLGDHDQVVQMHDWLMAMATPEGWLPPLQDSTHVPAGPLLVSGHHLAPKPEYKALAEATMTGEEIAALLAPLPPRDGVPAARTWTAGSSAAPESRSAWLPESRYFVTRSGWRPGSLYAAVNCGGRVSHELESHSHRACLDIILWGYGQPLAWEAGGPENYDDPAYQEWFQAPRGHSAVVFDDRTPHLEAGAAAETVGCYEPLAVLVAHHDGWGPRHRRTFLAVHPDGEMPGYWVVADDVAGKATWRWLLHGRSGWRRTGKSTFTSTESPGLEVYLVGVREMATGVGRTSYPSPGGAVWGDLHTLDVVPRQSTVTAVLVPYRDQPPHLGVSAFDAGLRLDWGGTVDEISRNAWTRRTAGSSATTVAWETVGKPRV